MTKRTKQRFQLLATTGETELGAKLTACCNKNNNDKKQYPSEEYNRIQNFWSVSCITSRI